ncbi:MAG: glycosyltransferase [Chloroflexota bacterium]|nr:glycosyltransferase [Chloroflexota bacterium]
MSALRNGLLVLLAIAQMAAGLRVAIRLLRTGRGTRIQRSAAPCPGERVTVIVPVLDERQRLMPCLDGLMAQPDEVQEILVVDGGSRDGTQALVRAVAEGDARLRLLDATPIPVDWNGKAHGLQTGLLHADPQANWILTIDADVRPHPDLVRSLLAHVHQSGVALQGVATRQVVSGAADGLLHPALLTTLVYRHGIPGNAASRILEVQANGQCSLFRREPLEHLGGFAVARDSRCEDVTMARALAEAGCTVGFHEVDGLIEAAMYGGWRDTWQNWPRSLTLRDRYWNLDGWLRLAEVKLAQGLPLAVLAISWQADRQRSPAKDFGPGELPAKHDALDPRVQQRALQADDPGSFAGGRGASVARKVTPGHVLRAVNIGLFAMRLGILAGTRRAYREPPVTYWLSPLLDLPVSLRLWQSALQGSHTWRGRTLVPEDVWSVT